jgi:diacylglycerol kinase (ATP)
MSKPGGQFSLRSRIMSFRYALEGLRLALVTQHNFRIHLVAAMSAIGLGLLWQISADDWRWLVVAIAIVLAAGLINTSFEHLCDLVQPELHASVRAAKDVAAGAVLTVSLAAAIIGIMVFWPYMALALTQALR